MSDRINCRNCIHFNDLEHKCCLNNGNEIKKECYFILSKRKPKGKDIVIENLKTKISDLEAKLAESEKEFEMVNITKENILRLFETQSNRIQEFENKLAEKDKEIEQLNSIILLSQLQAPKEQILNLLGSQCIQYNTDQDKISFCIEKLEKVKDELTKLEQNYNLNLCDVKIYNFIDNQIKQLKEQQK